MGLLPMWRDDFFGHENDDIEDDHKLSMSLNLFGCLLALCLLSIEVNSYHDFTFLNLFSFSFVY